mgnify:CR=1 FL=1
MTEGAKGLPIGWVKAHVIELLRRNGRFGYSLIGDLNAQIAAGRTGEARYRAILDHYYPGAELIRIR